MEKQASRQVYCLAFGGGVLGDSTKNRPEVVQRQQFNVDDEPFEESCIMLRKSLYS